MTASPALVPFLKRHEREVLYTYDDDDPKCRPIKAGDPVRGTLTAGCGHTGKDVVAGMAVTREMSDAWLHADIARHEQYVDQGLKVELSPLAKAGLVSLMFNVGPGRRKGALGPNDPGRAGILTLENGKPSSVLRAINEERWDDVPGLWAKWNRSGGKVSKGLIKRRAAELAELWVQGEVASSAVTVDPPKPKPVAKDPTALATGAAGVTAAIVAAKQVADVAAELQTALGPTMGEYAVAGVALIVVAAVGVIAWRHLKRRKAEAA